MLSPSLLRSLLHGRWTGLAGTFVALCLGAAVLTASALLLTSAGPRVPARYAAAPLLVRTPGTPGDGNAFAENRPWSPETVEALVRALTSVPGVAAAVPDRAFYAQAVVRGGPAGAHEARGWSTAALAPHRLVAGRPPVRAGEVVLDRALGLAPGSPVTLLTAGGPAPYTVSGLADGPGPYVSDGEAARLGGGVRVIGLLTRPGFDRAAVGAAVRAAVGDAARRVAGGSGQVLAGPDRAAAEPAADARTRWIGMQVLTAMALLGGFVSVFVVASTFAFRVTQRRREFGLLRAVGATPRQVRLIVYGEALAVGAAAAAAGALLGAVVAPAVGGVLVAAGFEPASFGVRPAPLPVAGAVAAGIAAGLLGAWSASGRAARVRPLEALRDHAAGGTPMTRVRWVAGVVSLAGGLALAAASGSAAEDALVNDVLLAAMALIAGLTLLAPVVLPALVRVLSWPISRPAVGMLAARSAMTAVRRTAATAAPVLLTVGFAVLVTGMVRTTAAAYTAGRAADVSAAAVLVPDGAPGLSDAALAAASAPAAITAPLPTTVYGDRPLTALGDGDLAGDEAAVAEWVARDHGWRKGDVVPLTFEDGRAVRLRIAAVLPGAPAEVLVARDTVRAHDPSALTPEAYVSRPAGMVFPGARTVSVADRAAGDQAEEDRLVWLFTLLLVGVSAGYSGLAIVNTQVMAASARAREFAVLRLSGATRRQATAAAAAEAALVTGIGSLLGLAVAVPALLAMRAGLAQKSGADVPLVVPWPTVAAVVAACLVLAAGASAIFTGKTAFTSVRTPSRPSTCADA
ncbi:ABC transporter permease [Microbispora bryophytorum]|uniref:ABC transporter permease n=1 Tax=Microbispora bryophytorum TaxID=1460882 RepID=A0A8H9H537_9ACTN|nr:ABC transporter permease [Microbispora bryophytorum]MBD3139228.1 ABC transporter permease [Microbispora bryophytorum]TQS03361.1 ABC transporter permease [Microbispora bryophytorum]GGO15648.1 ABC transporter permease [Microbispora bryophytorum]